MTMKKLMTACIVSSAMTATAAFAGDLPGEGVKVQPIKGSSASAWFQQFVVTIGLEQLGYEVLETQEADFPAMHLAVASGDADFTFNHWNLLHDGFFQKAGGDSVMTRVQPGVTGAGQGFYIDMKTAESNGITDLGQMKDPKIAALFDADGDGKANLSGCNPGWGCELAIEAHMDNFELRDAVQHDQGSYFAIMADTITRYNEGGSILYYTWTPNWISDVLVPGKDVVQIGVPSDSGFDAGFAVNDIYIVANNDFLEDNPAAAKFFQMVEIPIGAVNAQQLKMRDGEDKVEDFRRHAEEWIASNQAEFDSWVNAAK